MDVVVDWDKVIDVDFTTEGDVYIIDMVFRDGCVMTYGYTDRKKFMKDCTAITEERFLCG